MKHLLRLRSYLASRRAAIVRREAIRDYRESMLRARSLERRAVRLSKLASGVRYCSKPWTPARGSEKWAHQPETQRPRSQRSGLSLEGIRLALSRVSIVGQ